MNKYYSKCVHALLTRGRIDCGTTGRGTGNVYQRVSLRGQGATLRQHGHLRVAGLLLQKCWGGDLRTGDLLAEGGADTKWNRGVPGRRQLNSGRRANW